MTADPPCNCTPVKGAHDERCAVIRYRRSPEYQPDLTPPDFLQRPVPDYLKRSGDSADVFAP